MPDTTARLQGSPGLGGSGDQHNINVEGRSVMPDRRLRCEATNRLEYCISDTTSRQKILIIHGNVMTEVGEVKYLGRILMIRGKYKLSLHPNPASNRHS